MKEGFDARWENCALMNNIHIDEAFIIYISAQEVPIVLLEDLFDPCLVTDDVITHMEHSDGV